MSDETKIIESTETRKVTYCVDGVMREEEVEVKQIKHVRADGTIKKLVLQPAPIRINAQTKPPGE